MFDFEKMLVYQRSERLLTETVELAKNIPRGHRQLADQLLRSTSSTCLHVAEGAGEFLPREKARFYRIALRSATESASIIRILHRLEILPRQQYQDSYHALLEITKMLAKLASSFAPQEKEKVRTRKKGARD